MSPNKKPKLESLEHFSSKYYPSSMSRQKIITKYLKDENKPYNILIETLEQTEKERNNTKPGKYVAHWFDRDLRHSDNLGLYRALEVSNQLKRPLITFYVYCLEDLRSHSISPHQLQYKLKTLKILQQDLLKKNIPLYFLDVNCKTGISTSILHFLKKYQVSHLFSNIEYEVDELRLVTRLVKTLTENNISYLPQHDSCVVLPGLLKTKSKGTQYSVFTPWYRSWITHLDSLQENGQDPFHDYTSSHENPPAVHDDDFLKELFGDSNKVPPIPESHKLTPSQQQYFDEHWTFGEHHAYDELLRYIQSTEIKQYNDLRNNILTAATSQLSHHLANGSISARSIIRSILEKKLVLLLGKGNAGITEWIRQVSWRDFYKHVMVNWPFVCMFKPFQIEYDDIEWEYQSDHFSRWCQGKTGFPIVDAAMRELNKTGYMHNRCRMVVASFLSKHLLIDWRNGERYFMEHLIDGDFASNNGGWGFSSSVGVDPQPYFRIFNPWTQSEKFDKKGDYIRTWVPELREITDSKGIHNPYANGYEDIAERNHYPKPIVDHPSARERALQRYRDAR